MAAEDVLGRVMAGKAVACYSAINDTYRYLTESEATKLIAELTHENAVLRRAIPTKPRE